MSAFVDCKPEGRDYAVLTLGDFPAKEHSIKALNKMYSMLWENWVDLQWRSGIDRLDLFQEKNVFNTKLTVKILQMG